MRTPLTEAEHARLRELLAHGRGAKRQPEDDRLVDLGLVAVVAGITWARQEILGSNGLEPYYERSTGEVNPVSYPTIGQPDVLAPRRER